MSKKLRRIPLLMFSFTHSSSLDKFIRVSANCGLGAESIDGLMSDELWTLVGAGAAEFQ